MKISDIYNSYVNQITELKQEKLYLESCLKRKEKQINEANQALKDVKEKALSVNLSGLGYFDRKKMICITSHLLTGIGVIH